MLKSEKIEIQERIRNAFIRRGHYRGDYDQALSSG